MKYSQEYYTHVVNQAIDQLKHLKGDTSDTCTQQVLTLGISNKKDPSASTPSIFISESTEMLTSYYSVRLLELFSEGVSDGLIIPESLLEYIANKFAQHIKTNGTSKLNTLFNVSGNDFKRRNKKEKHSLKIIKTIALTVCYRGFRCGFAYKALGIYINKGKLVIGSSNIMTKEYIISQVNSHYPKLGPWEKTLLYSFISGYEKNTEVNTSPNKNKLSPPYEPDLTCLLELSRNLVHYLVHEEEPKENEVIKVLTKEDIADLNTLYYPRNSTAINRIEKILEENIRMKHPNKNEGDIKKEVHNRLELSHIDKLSDSPQLIYISKDYGLPLLLITDKQWQKDANKFFIEMIGYTSEIRKDIEELNHRLEA